MTMKTKPITSLLAVLAGILIFTTLPQTAQAGHSIHRRIHHTCRHCHTPVYSYRSISHYGSHGNPFYRWSIRAHSHGSYGHDYGHGYEHGYSYHRPRIGFSFFFGHH